MQVLVERRIYPFLLMAVGLLAVLCFQLRQFKRLYEHIKNDKSVVECSSTVECIHSTVGFCSSGIYSRALG